MKVSHRLYLTVSPGLVGVLVVAALAYWGQLQHQVPELVVIIAAAATVASLLLAWLNARYVATRIERLAGGSPAAVKGAPDELEAIEDVVDRLSSAVTAAASGNAMREREAGARVRDYATLMAMVTEDAARRLEEVRLPLHILLENHFGDLNENQDEMLAAARAAADAADADLEALRRIADIERGARALRRDRIHPRDLVNALRPTLQAQAEQRGVSLRTEVEPVLPPVLGDQAELQEALATLFGAVIGSTPSATEVWLRLEREGDGCVLALRGAGNVPRSVQTALARRVIVAMGGVVDRRPSDLRVTLR